VGVNLINAVPNQVSVTLNEPAMVRKLLRGKGKKGVGKAPRLEEVCLWWLWC
jgi:hypothetical protein